MNRRFNIQGLRPKRNSVPAGDRAAWPGAGPTAAVALTMLLLAPSQRALAVCAPAAADNVNAVCTGATVDQGTGPPGTSAGAAGYGSTALFNLNVNVAPLASITATGGDGIQVASGTVTNAGTITAAQRGIFADIVGVNVINSGIITANLNGIAARAVDLFNTGTISGLNGVGTASGNIVNFGTITGVNSGIDHFTNAMTVVNAGTISGGITAISTTASVPDTLTLLPGSRLIGALVLGGGGDTINFRTGNQNLTFDTLAGATVTSTVPFAVNGGRAVTIDPTPFVTAGTTLGDFSRAVSSAVPTSGGLPATGGAAGTAFAATASPASIVASAFEDMPGLSAYASDRAVFKAPTVAYANGVTFWARGFAGERTQQADGVVLRNVSNFFGGAMGMDKRVAPNLSVGGFVGGGSTRSSFDLNAGSTDSNLGFGGLYAHYLWGASFLRAAIQGGGSSNDSARNINNNLAPAGFETARASYSGWYVSPELTLGHRIALGHVFGAQHTLTPSVQVRYLYGSFGSYTETGSTANLTVNSQTVQTLEERAELRLTRLTPLSADTTLSVQVTGGALAMQRVGGNTVSAVLLGLALPFATPGQGSSWGGYGSVGMELRHNNVAVFGSAEYLALNDDSGIVTGKAGVRVVY